MTSRAASPIFLLASGIVFWAAAGCSIIPEPTADPTRFYLLTSASAATAPAVKANAPAIYLRPVQLTDYLRTRSMIVRLDSNEIVLRDFARWGEALGPGIGRVLREELLARGAASTVSVNALKSGDADRGRELNVRVLTCEGGADGSVRFHARWNLAAIEGGEPVRGDYRSTNLQWDGKNEGSLAAALSEAIAGLAAEIAGAMKH